MTTGTISNDSTTKGHTRRGEVLAADGEYGFGGAQMDSGEPRWIRGSPGKRAGKAFKLKRSLQQEKLKLTLISSLGLVSRGSRDLVGFRRFGGVLKRRQALVT
jgi:hypothetical protein